MNKIRGLLFSILLLHAIQVAAADLAEINPSVRALGMGNAFVAMASGAASLYYNPAGLATSSVYSWTILDPYISLGGISSLTQIQGGGGGSFEQYLGQPLAVIGGAKTILTMPYFAIGMYDHAYYSFLLTNPVSPQFQTYAVNDLGYIMGFGLPLWPGAGMGIAVRRVDRTGGDQPIGGGVILSGDPNQLIAATSNRGTGYGGDFGITFAMPGPISPTFSFVWRNLGTTSYIPLGTVAPPADRDNMIFGMAFDISMPTMTIRPTFDFTHINNYNEQIGKKLHLGVELSIPFFEFRAGLNQGYYTLGLGMKMGLMKLDFATYGVELGAYPGQIEDRRYALQVTFEMGIEGDISNVFKGGSGKGGAGGGGPSGRGGSLKHRR